MYCSLFTNLLRLFWNHPPLRFHIHVLFGNQLNHSCKYFTHLCICTFVYLHICVFAHLCICTFRYVNYDNYDYFSFVKSFVSSLRMYCMLDFTHLITIHQSNRLYRYMHTLSQSGPKDKRTQICTCNQITSLNKKRDMTIFVSKWEKPHT